MNPTPDQIIISSLEQQLSDSQKQIALSIEELATTYFVKQMADMREYIESIRKSFQTDEQKFDALALQLMNWAGVYVHGANLASTKLMLDQSQKQLADSLSIQHAEKQILLHEIERNVESQKQVAMLRDALSPLVVWWAFIQAQHELEESKPFDEHVIALSFMGSGASTNVTVGQLNAIIKALSSTTPPPYVHEDRVKQARIKAMGECLELYSGYDGLSKPYNAIRSLITAEQEKP